jgi:hypothetical protein
MGSTAFRRIQIGLESTRGTAVAADTVLYGTMTMTPEVVYHRPVDEINSIAEFRRSVATQHNATMRFQGDALFEQIIQFLSMTLRGGISTTTPGTASRDWTFTPNIASANTQDSFTFEYGDNTQEWESAFVICSSMELQITMGEVVQLSADMFGRFAAKSSFTGSLAEGVVNEVLADGARIFINTAWGDVGNTEFNTILAGGTIRLNSGVVPVRYADGLDTNGNATFSTVVENRRSHSMDLDIIANANGVAQVYDAFVANTNRAIRIVFDLAANSIESGYNHELEIDMFGKFTSPPELFGERDGENIMRVTFTSHDDGSGNEVKVRVRNSVTAI